MCFSIADDYYDPKEKTTACDDTVVTLVKINKATDIIYT